MSLFIGVLLRVSVYPSVVTYSMSKKGYKTGMEAFVFEPRPALKVVGLLAAVTLAGILPAQEIPPGVRYKKAKPEVNAKFSAMLTDLMAGRIADSKLLDCYDNPVICGPGLWPTIKKINGKELTGNLAQFMVPTGSGEKMQVLEGRFFKTNADRLDFAITIGAIAKLAPMKIRPLTKSEIAYYWAIIPYDIEEPLMAAESKKLTLIFNAAGGKILFVDMPMKTEPAK